MAFWPLIAFNKAGQTSAAVALAHFSVLTPSPGPRSPAVTPGASAVGDGCTGYLFVPGAVQDFRHCRSGGKPKISSMKTLWGALAIAATGLLCAPVATADDSDDSFLLTLKSESIYLADSSAIAAGHVVCSDFASGATPAEVLLTVIYNTGLSFDDAGFLGGAAVSAYCPQFKDRMYG